MSNRSSFACQLLLAGVLLLTAAAPLAAFPATLSGRTADYAPVPSGALPPALRQAWNPVRVQRAPWIAGLPVPVGWIERTVVASDGVMEDTFGAAVAIDGDTALVSAPQPGSDVGGIPAGHGLVYVFSKQGAEWIETAQLRADDGADGDFFGYAVALHGDTALVGAHTATVDGVSQQGAAYVFHRANGSWMQTAKLVAADGGQQSLFGASLAIDGDNAFVGAYGTTVDGNFGEGAVYVYSDIDGTPTFTAELFADDGLANGQFGYSVAAHGGTLMVGSPNATVDDEANRGAVYLFTQDGTTWTQAQKIVADDGVGNDAFGIAISYDDTHALISTPTANTFTGGFYAFATVDGAWTQTQKILPPDDFLPGDIFYGFSLALSGNDAVVTYPSYDAGKGRVDLYGFDAVAGWTKREVFTHDNGDPADVFPNYGSAAAILDGTLLIGADYRTVDGNLYQGTAYFYTRDSIFEDGFDGR